MKKITLIGNLGRAPESKYTPEGKMICEFSLAVQVGSGENKKTEWYDCAAWEKTAEILAKYLDKGSKLYVEGPFKLETWSKKDTGEPQAKIVVTVREFEFLSPKKNKDDDAEQTYP